MCSKTGDHGKSLSMEFSGLPLNWLGVIASQKQWPLGQLEDFDKLSEGVTA
ncbi:MAG: hypothetical protein HC883_05930 [Bdellovibrionaceae bacterium]|nr:hypothetical protein [Pseudobdellovibrionaceae bacterium]